MRTIRETMRVAIIPRKASTRIQRINALERYFLKELVEDPFDGSSFDCDILDHLKALGEKYKGE